MRNAVLVALIAAAGTLAGCASGPRLSAAQQLALHEQHAGAPVDSFRIGLGLSGWNSIDDRHLVVHTRPGEAWLLVLQHDCPGLAFAQNIGLTSQIQRVQARFDRVLVRDGIVHSCRIGQIRPLDSKALGQAQTALRQAIIEERQQEAGGDEGTPPSPGR